MRLNLNGNWRMKRRSDEKEFPAVVPGTDFGTLIKCGEIADPLISGAESEALATASDDYSFTRRFSVTAEMLERKKALLKCFRVDTLCEVFINSRKAVSLNNAFVPLNTDVKDFLTVGENEITFAFSSPYLYIKERQEKHPLPPNSNGVNGIPYIRKPGCHFGWDMAAAPYVEEILCYQHIGLLNEPGTDAFCGHPDSQKLFSELQSLPREE